MATTGSVALGAQTKPLYGSGGKKKPRIRKGRKPKRG